ncbi:hypothetical protein TNIN_95451 [Trichonephila inaurata madagascariensis]|uniref:Uncharacterized protein n=1 Tax=Trichonephila inaurata madagascariensis TaxID=2747483 RepID=A0A8X6YMD3_9ARAC|nr:hypothetical protein TNIN_95451 [Trichonephila inaurata madagascariensis]
MKLIIKRNRSTNFKNVLYTSWTQGFLAFYENDRLRKKHIAFSLEKKIEVSVILENIRNDRLSREHIIRIHLTNTQDIKNIKSFGLTNQQHVDDATSVRLMLEETSVCTDVNFKVAYYPNWIDYI